MASTTNYSWSTPDDTALVKDGASAIRTLGSSVDTTLYTINNGSNKVGLHLLNATTLTNVSSVTVDNVFTSTYLNYRVLFEFNGSTNANRTITFAFRAGGSTISAANYQTCTDGAYTGGGTSKTAYFYSDNAKTYFNIIDNSYYSANKCSFNVDVITPQTASFSNVSGTFLGAAAANHIQGNFSGTYTANTAMDGFILNSTSGNMTGTLKIYGYRN